MDRRAKAASGGAASGTASGTATAGGSAAGAAAAGAAAVMFGAWLVIAWAIVNDSPTVGEYAGVLVFLGIWYVLAAAAIAHHAARAARGHDLPARLVAGATAGRRGPRADWGTAMRAELASIDNPRERRTFALGCAWAALRTGWGRGPLLAGAASCVLFAAITLIASRLMLAGDQTGLAAAVVVGLPQLLFTAIALIAARTTRSFRRGLEYGAVALLASLLGILIIAIPESIRWYDEAGIWLLDGDYPTQGIPNTSAAIQDALTGLTTFFLLFTTPYPALGAWLGTHRPFTQTHPT